MNAVPKPGAFGLPVPCPPEAKPLSQGWATPPQPRIEATRCNNNNNSSINKKISHQFHQNSSPPQVPAPYGVSPLVPCIVLVRLTPSPYKKRLMSLSVYQFPPSNPFRLSLLWSQCIVVRWFSYVGCLSANGVIRQWWQCAGFSHQVVIGGAARRDPGFTPSRAAAASRQWLMLLGGVQGTAVSPAPRRIRLSEILSSLHCRRPNRCVGV